MLKQRIISALVMVALVIWGVLSLDATGFAVAIAVLIALSSWEWSKLIPLSGWLPRAVYSAAVLGVVALAWRYLEVEDQVYPLLWLALAWWVFALLWILQPDWGRSRSLLHSIAKSLLGILLLVSTWSALIVLHGRLDSGQAWVLFLMALIWIADSGAFFSGRRWGKQKLAPQVSPGKTWEGVYGAVSGCALFAVAYALYIGLPTDLLIGFVLVCVITVLFSIAGDLLISLLKRHQQMKDSGNMIPGHGGILDRLDSLLAATPVFVLGMRWVGI